MYDDPNLELISAYADGELTAEQRQRVERLLADSEEHRRFLDELLALRAGLHALPQLSLPPGFHEVVLRSAERRLLTEGSGDPRPAPTNPLTPHAAATSDVALAKGQGGRRWLWPAAAVLLVAAASLLLLLSQTLWINQPTPPSPPSREGLVWPQRGDREPAARIGSQQYAQSTPSQQPSAPAEEAAARDESREFVSQGIAGAKIPYLMLIEVALTPEGIQQGAFETALADAGIVFDTSLRVDRQLEEALLATRLFGALQSDDLKPAGEVAESPLAAEDDAFVELVYVVARAPQIVAAWQDLLGQQSRVAAVKVDVVIKSREMQLFEQLDRASTLQIAAAGSDDERAEGEGARRNSITGRAQRLALSVALQSRLARNLRLLSIPAVGALTVGRPPENITSPPGIQPPSKQQSSLQHFPMDIDYQVLFVIRSADSIRRQSATGSDKD